jgi:hypothetical protein
MKKYLFLFTFLIAGQIARAQTAADSIMNALNATTKPEPVMATFKSTWLILSQTTETVKKNNLNFLVVHRFGDIGGPNGGGQTFFGLDASTDIYIGFEYGLTDNFNIDFGRSKFEQLIDLGFKYALLRQKSDDSTPFALTLIGKAGLKPYKVNTNVFYEYSNRFSYFAQAVIARKFSPAFSLQIAPGFVRNNLPFPYLPGSEKQFFSLSGAARLKLTKRFGVVVDYSHPFSDFRKNNSSINFYDPLGLGIEIETGGHVFTINFTNAKAISQINYLSDTESKWAGGQFRIGFTISRIFDLNPRHKSTWK